MHVRSMLLAATTLGAFAAASFAQTPVAPVAGDIAVSEIMFNPGPEVCVTDADGEYFEIVNISNKALDLNGIYVEDRNATTGLPTGVGFQVLPSVATLPTLYPGQSFVFVRHATGNGPLPIAPAYVYAATTTTAPGDKSQVGSGQMNLNNSGMDGLFIAVGNFASLGGTIIEEVSYNASSTPLTPNSGIAAERINLFAPWQVSQTVNPNDTNNNVGQAIISALYGVPNGTTCLLQQRGTPGSRNSIDTTSWIQPNHYSSFNDSLNQNTGTLIPTAPASVNASGLQLAVGGGPANGSYSLGYGTALPELYINLFIPGNPGAILLDLNTAAYLSDPSFLTDGSGNGSINIPLSSNPGLVGLTFSFQWIALDFNTFQVLLSNGLTVTLAP
ncbi:MAG: lamin tail domain-containing protein [Planctomycetes bacterium]|nr:lamin tail domain-containing protein [Planctomycetota bacterium]